MNCMGIFGLVNIIPAMIVACYSIAQYNMQRKIRSDGLADKRAIFYSELEEWWFGKDSEFFHQWYATMKNHEEKGDPDGSRKVRVRTLRKWANRALPLFEEDIISHIESLVEKEKYDFHKQNHYLEIEGQIPFIDPFLKYLKYEK